MTIGTTTALTIIQAALRRIQSYQSGDTLSQVDETDCLDTLNDLLDSWSIQKLNVFGSNEWIMNWTSGKRIYQVGNPTNAMISGSAALAMSSTSPNGSVVYPNTTGGQNWPNFTGNLSSGSNVITGVTNIPSNLVAGATTIYLPGSGSILTDSANVIPANTTVTAFNAVAQTVTMSNNATSNATLDSISYTVPGDFPIPRPLRITSAFTRFNNLDFTLKITETQEEFNSILYKQQPGPWPTVAWYNNTFPYGLLNVYQIPGNSAELHLFVDTILSNLTLNQVISMPQGYARALKWALAKELCAEYGFPMSDSIKMNADESLKVVQALNAKPGMVSTYDRALIGRRRDAGWILHGGYN